MNGMGVLTLFGAGASLASLIATLSAPAPVSRRVDMQIATRERGIYARPDRLVTFVALPEPMDSWSGSLLSVPAAYTGQITGVLIRWGATDYVVPATVPLNSSVELVAYGRLGSMSVAVKCGMRAVVTAPGKAPVTWVKEMWTKQDPGQTLRFDIKSFFADTPGVWTAYIEYYPIP